MSLFFEEFFAKRGESIEPNHQGEVQVRCPFPHDKGLDVNASASFNVEERVYKCFTCSAEDREKGMSEVSFIAKVYDTTYDNAVFIRNMQIDGDTDNLVQLTSNLLSNTDLKTYLNNRGITDEAIREYQLGYAGDGILYPVILNGILVDKRTYRPDAVKPEPKITSMKHAKPLLFPYDHWVNDERSTLLTAGENDTILARIHGFNAVETTLGEGSIPKILLNKFKNRKVYICYDCDEAGRKAAKRMAFYLKEVGAEVYILSLGLSGTKDDKDVTDFFIKHHKTSVDLHFLMDEAPLFSEDDYVEQKNKEFPLVALWDIRDSRYSNQYISSRVLQSGHYEFPSVDIPSSVEWRCLGALESKVCDACPIRSGSEGTWQLGSNNLEDLLYLVEVDENTQTKGLRKLCGLPQNCPHSRINTLSKAYVEKVIVSPDVESESESSGFKQAELHAYILNGDTDDGNRYRMYFKRVPHPKDQSMVLVVDKVEDSDNAINTFKVTPQFLETMKKWQGNPFEMMRKRYEELGKKAVGKYLPESIFYASEIIYHSILDYKFMGKYIKGHPEGLIIGASRTGKSEVGKAMANFYGLGNVKECKSVSAAGLIGGVDKSANGTMRISWGSIPRNHKGLLFMDEVSGMSQDIFKQLTGLRSEREAIIEKIRKGKAPAKTRLLWVGNPRLGSNKRSRSLYDYPSGVDVCLDMFPTDEDVARFDFIVLVPEPEEYISPLNDDGTVPEDSMLPDELRQLVRWAWSRKRDQVVFDAFVERYIENIAKELNKDFESSVKIIGVEGVRKIARIAVSVATCCCSCTADGESVLVKKEHVDWVKQFLLNCYDNNIFRLREYVVNERKFSTINEEIILQVASLSRKYPMIVKLLLEQESCPAYNLQAAGGIAGDEYRHLTNSMYTSGLIQANKNGFSATRRLKLAVDALTTRTAQKQQTMNDKPRSFSERINLK